MTFGPFGIPNECRSYSLSLSLYVSTSSAAAVQPIFTVNLIPAAICFAQPCIHFHVNEHPDIIYFNTCLLNVNAFLASYHTLESSIGLSINKVSNGCSTIITIILNINIEYAEFKLNLSIFITNGPEIETTQRFNNVL